MTKSWVNLRKSFECLTTTVTYPKTLHLRASLAAADNASLSETTEDTEDSFRDLISFKQRGPVSAAQRASTAGTSKRPSTAATTMTPRTSKVIRNISSSFSKTSSGVLSEAIDEFPIVLPSLLGDLLQPEPSLVSQASEPMDPIPQKHQKTSSELGDYYENEENRSETESSTVSVEIQIQGVDTDTEYSVKRKLEFPSIDSSVTSSRQSSFMSNEFEDARSHSSLSLTTSSEVSTSSSSSSLKFKRNSKADKEQSEAMSEMEPIERDYKKMYSSLVDPSTLDDSLFNLLADVSYEDAVAETEMKIVLKELQHWAQSKFAPLFVDDLEEPQKFLKSFQLPVSRNDPQKLASRLDPRSSLATGKRLSNVSNSATNPTERPSGTSHHQGYRSSIVASIDGGEEKNKEFEELLQMTPWRPALEDSNRKEVGKGVSLEEKTPKTLVKRLKDAGMVDSGAIIDNTPVIDSIAVKRAKSATKAAV
ncbi:hypothetical protein BDR26DRAFT_397517 [Obelidium mucronatum]|nr:hypothetical protein BDR26DRAFT_397517 [Obelidium mucronatum]